MDSKKILSVQKALSKNTLNLEIKPNIKLEPYKIGEVVLKKGFWVKLLPNV